MCEYERGCESVSEDVRVCGRGCEIVWARV